jgi:hypothetical protein
VSRPPAVFVLSAGRTGTVFLTHTLPERFPRLVCHHEPPGSRSNLVFANARNLTGLGTRLLRARFRAGLERRLAGVPSGSTYVEVNPMLCPLADLVGELPDLRVIHLVREPASWVRSIRAFRASERFRPLIDHLPLATPFPAPRPPGWSRLDPVCQALWRWRYCNERILALEDVAARYDRFRYEDLFQAGPAQAASLRGLLAALDLQTTDLDGLIDRSPRNPAPDVDPVHVPDDAVASICGELAAQLGYPRP